MTQKGDVDTEANAKSDLERKFGTLAREMAFTVREHSADPDANRRLRLALERAEQLNMPEEDIEAALERGAGEVEAPTLEATTFEGYGPENVAVFVVAITEDVSRTREGLAETFEAHGGSLGEDGCVAWQFERRGQVLIDSRDVDDEDGLLLELIELGADELKEPLYEPGEAGKISAYTVYCAPEDVDAIAGALEEDGYRVRGAETVREATQTVKLDRDQARKFISFYEKLTGREDVQDVYANWEPA